MEAIIDSVRRIVSKWVNTSSPLIEDLSLGSRTIKIKCTKRFRVNDEVMIGNPLSYETGLHVDEIIDENTLRLSSVTLAKDWTVNENAVLLKTINEMFVQGVYFGDPEVIPEFPAITVFGTDRTSEWLTLDSTSERYELQINIYVLESTHEFGHRFLLQMADVIQLGLKKNIYPLVGDHEVTALKADIVACDKFIKVTDASIFSEGNRVIVEDSCMMQEAFVQAVIDHETLALYQGISDNYAKDDTIVIAPERFVYNSWPASIDFGKVHKGDLLQAATISWFAEEEELQNMRKQDPQLK